MSKFDSNVLITHLEKKWAGRSCHQCGVSNWQIQDSVYELRQFNKGGFIIGGSVVPVVPVTCGNCGNTVLVNAILSGIIPKPEGMQK